MLWIVTFCPPALAIHPKGPDAPIPPRRRFRAHFFAAEAAKIACGTILSHRAFTAKPPAWEHVDQEFIMRKLLTFALVAGSLLVAACNTVEGAGRDVQSVGNAVEDAAD